MFIASCIYRFKSTSARQSLDAPLFGYDYSALSLIFNKVVDFIDTNHSHRLRFVPQISGRFPEFNERVRAKLREKFPGLPLPPEAEGVVLFSDCCRVAVCRPEGLLLIRALLIILFSALITFL